MRKAGYKNLYWLSGGFDAADDGVSARLNGGVPCRLGILRFNHMPPSTIL